MNTYSSTKPWNLSFLCKLYIVITYFCGVCLVPQYLTQFSNVCEVLRHSNIRNNFTDTTHLRINVHNKCVNVQEQDINVNRTILDFLGHGDTLTGNDVVTRQYENLPYPPFAEDQIVQEEEWYNNKPTNLVFLSNNQLEIVNHFLHNGNDTFRNFYRLIVPGGGTGGTTVGYGDELKHTNAEIVYVDFSMASMKISQRRARAIKLKNIIWINSWIEDTKYHGLGIFNALSCSGVLHHLKSPELGLKTLKDQLMSEGGMHLMVYARYGRSSVYHMQKLMKLINYDRQEIQNEIMNTNLTLNVLPKSNWFDSSPDSSFNIRDHLMGDIGLYDLFLHKRDVSYCINTLCQWLENAGLHFVGFESIRRLFNLKLRQMQYLDKNTKLRVSRLNLSYKLHITEILNGDIIKHQFYASKIENSEADLFDPSTFLPIHGDRQDSKQNISNRKNIEILDTQMLFEINQSKLYI